MLLYIFTAPSLSAVVMPNDTVPDEQIEPTSIIMDLPTTIEPFRYMICVRGLCLIRMLNYVYNGWYWSGYLEYLIIVILRYQSNTKNLEHINCCSVCVPYFKKRTISGTLYLCELTYLLEHSCNWLALWSICYTPLEIRWYIITNIWVVV